MDVVVALVGVGVGASCVVELVVDELVGVLDDADDDELLEETEDEELLLLEVFEVVFEVVVDVEVLLVLLVLWLVADVEDDDEEPDGPLTEGREGMSQTGRVTEGRGRRGDGEAGLPRRRGRWWRRDSQHGSSEGRAQAQADSLVGGGKIPAISC